MEYAERVTAIVLCETGGLVAVSVGHEYVGCTRIVSSAVHVLWMR